MIAQNGRSIEQDVLVEHLSGEEHSYFNCGKTWNLLAVVPERFEKCGMGMEWIYWGWDPPRAPGSG